MVKRVDAYEKVTGKAIYADDINLDGMLYAAQLYSEYPFAKVENIDITEVSKADGVEAILLAKDVPGKLQACGVIWDHFVLVTDKVRYMGDVLAVVVAQSEAKARDALKLINVKYSPLPPLTDPQEALKDSSPRIHVERDNIVSSFKVRTGDAVKTFEKCEHKIEREFETSFIEHAYMEPESAVAIPNPDGSVTVYSSTQHPFSVRKVVAAVCDLPLSSVQIIQTTLGGGFGGKDDTIALVSARTALAAIKTQKPVKITLKREESFRESYKRHPFKAKYKVGIDKAGKIQAMVVDLTADSGPYCSTSPFVIWRPTVQCTGPYKVKNVHCDTRAVYTNNTYTGAMRGFGTPQSTFIIESTIDECAKELGIDPWEFRKQNFFRQNETTHTKQKLNKHKVSIEEVVDQALTRFKWNEKFKNVSLGKPDANGNYYGVGFACSYRGVSLGAEGNDFCSAVVKIMEDGSILLESGVSENGQGLKTVMTTLLAGELGIDSSKITFVDTDTSSVPDGGPTVASRGTLVGGNAVIDAATRIKKIMRPHIAEMIGKSDDYRYKDGKIIHPKNCKSVTFEEAVKKCYQNKHYLHAVGLWKGPDVSWDEDTGHGNAYFTYVYGCQAVELSIDGKSGKVDVQKVVAAHDVGKAINPEMALGQIFGGIVMGLGFALMEKVEHKDGVIQNLNFNTYRIPKSTDIPEMEAILVENPDSHGPWGAKSLGEPTNELMGAAVANAVYYALGKRIYELPITVENIKKALRKPKNF
ncbi:MAG: xanthine dehydrogenase family protein molybdopterin-binding subunit [Pseudomonadota bacterium]